MITVTELDERIFKCRKILDEDPKSQIFAALAESYRKKGELGKAFQICQNGLKLHSEYGAAHVVMAKVNLDRRLYDWAEAEANKAIELDGKTRAIELLLAEISIYKGEFDVANKILKSLQQNDPNNTQIQKLLKVAQEISEEQARMMQSKSLSGSTKMEEETIVVKKVENKKQEPACLKPSDILEKAVETRNVNGALFVNEEGLIIDSIWNLKLDQAICAPLLKDMGLEMDDQLLDSSFGIMQSVLIETNDYVFYVIKNTNGTFIFVASSEVNLGKYKLNIDNLMKSYKCIAV